MIFQDYNKMYVGVGGADFLRDLLRRIDDGQYVVTATAISSERVLIHGGDEDRLRSLVIELKDGAK